MKLRTRFALFSIFLVSIVVAGTSFSALYFLKELVLREIETGQKTTVENLQKVCEESQISRDDILAFNYVASLQKTVKGMAFAAFVDTQRSLVLGNTDTFKEAIGELPEAVSKASNPAPKEVVSLKDGKKILSYALGVTLPAVGGSGPQKAGAVYIGFYQEAVEKNIQESIRRISTIILYVAAGAFVLGLVMAVFFAVGLTRPIHKLALGAQAIGEGNLDTQIDVKRNDEIGLLAAEFNTMAVKLKELDQLKDDFVSSVSHELRSPLTAISGYVELLTMKPFDQLNPEKATKALGIIQESTSRLTQFVNDILDVAKIKAGKMEIRKNSFDIKATAESIFGLFHPLFAKKGITPHVEIGSEVPVIVADGEKIRQVVTNLLSNAYKFTSEGGHITFAARILPTSRDMVTCYIRDTGIGIPKQHQHLVFGKFQQVPGAKDKISAGPKGTGLGLAIAKGIVEAHNGKIWFESEENKGTTFIFTLPVKAEIGTHVVESKKLA